MGEKAKQKHARKWQHQDSEIGILFLDPMCLLTAAYFKISEIKC